MAYQDYGKAPESWSEWCLVSVEEEGGNKLYFKSQTDSVKVSLGGKDFDSIPTVGGGRIVKFNPEEDSEVSFDLYPVSAGNAWATDGEEAAGFFDLIQGKDSSYDPKGGSPVVLQSITSGLARRRFRVTFMWTNDTSVTDPTAAFSSAYAALRISLCGYFTKVDPDFSDKVFKVPVTFKAPAFKKDGSANVQVASTDDGSTTALPALSSFTSTTNF